jgi:hypothetical protein
MKNIDIRYLFLTICLIFPFLGFGQTEKEIKSMLTDYRHEIDSSIHKIILDNTWESIYFYDKKLFGGTLEKIDTYSILKFEGDKFFNMYRNKNQELEVLFSGTYLFDGNYLYLYDNFPECPDYSIINLIDGKYLIVEIYLPIGRKNSYKSTNRRLLFQRQAK